MSRPVCRWFRQAVPPRSMSATARAGAVVLVGLALAASAAGLAGTPGTAAAAPAQAAVFEAPQEVSSPSGIPALREALTPPGRTLPEAIGAAPRVGQMITVSAKSFASTSATLKAWRRTARGEWVLAHGPVPVVVGYSGWAKAAERRQNTGTTPAGRFTLPLAFGRWADPGARLDYERVDANDWWPYEPRDPATYNIFQRHRAASTHWRRTFAERLDGYPTQYGYALVVGFNLPREVHYSRSRGQWVTGEPARIHHGGGIFLHVRGDGRTAGCVAMDRADMRWLVRWVRPGAHPQLVMGPHDYIVTL